MNSYIFSVFDNNKRNSVYKLLIPENGTRCAQVSMQLSFHILPLIYFTHLTREHKTYIHIGTYMYVCIYHQCLPCTKE